MSDQIGDANKKISETPRTDAMRGFHDLDTAVDAEFAEQLERELNEANASIKRLEEAGDAMVNGGWNEPHLAGAWKQAKEAKP